MTDERDKQLQRRSPVSLEFADATFRVVRGHSQPWTLHDLDNQPALFDLSLMPRFGVRGEGAADYLRSRSLPLPAEVNEVIAKDERHWIARLGKTEYWVLSASPDEQDSIDMEGMASHADGCYPVPCGDSRAWFVIDHPQRANMMAKLCGVDLRDSAFAVGRIAQTSVARVNAAVMHHSVCQRAVFSVFSDSASASYLWHAMVDALEEFDGGPGGLSDLFKTI